MIPLIGIVLDSEESGSFSARPYYALRKAYFAAIHAAGGLPVGLPHEAGLLASALASCHGILVPGGDYLFPAEWYADQTPSAYPANLMRSEVETELIRQCIASGKPLLGICAGMQALAGALGGKLTHQLPTTPINHRPESNPAALVHRLSVREGSLLARIIGGTTMHTNTHHREGVTTPGPQLSSSATAEDGTIEAIEHPSHPFALGVQWHPENNPEDPANAAIFRAFLSACRL